MGERPKITGCLIVKDEEAFLEECLTRLWKAVDDIVVVDTGSVDATVDIAKKMGARVFHHAWKGDFAEARNTALGYATHPWIFVIDADEYLDVSTIGHLDRLVEAGADGYLIDVVNFPDDDNARVISKHLALVKNDPRFRYEGAIHENIANSIARSGGKIGYLPIRVDHLGYSEEVRKAKNKGERNRSIILRELKRRPNDVLLNYYLAQEHFVHGEFEEAVKYYRRALWRVGPRGGNFVPGAAVRLMVSLWRLSRWDEAYEVLGRYQAEYLDYTDLHFLDGVLSRRLGDYRRAEGALLRALALGDASSSKYEYVHVGFGSYRAWTELGELYQELGKHREAFSAFAEALKANPKYVPAVARLARLALLHDQPPDVLRYLSRVARLESDSVVREAWEAFYGVKAWEECRALGRRLADDERRYKDALVSIGERAFEVARGTLLELAEKGKFHRLACETGVLLAIEEKNLGLARRFLVAYPLDEDPVAYATLTDVVVQLSSGGDTSPALSAAPADAKTHFAWNLVARAVALGLLEVLERLGTLLAWYGESPGQRALQFGRILQRRGLIEAATEQYLRAGLYGVYDADSLLQVARHGLETDSAEEVVALLGEIVELSPKRPFPYLLLAQTLWRMGDTERAKEVLAKGREENPYAFLLRVELDSASNAWAVK